ncbi:MAG TPA: hypothetical protein VNQ77_19555 [Frankiaceae bacterium]|nr:hypothetical protein [Frankiaceae bacterium]
MPLVRWPRTALAAALGLLAVLPPVVARAEPGAPIGDQLRACPENVTVTDDNWAKINAPENAPGDGANVIKAFAIPPQRDKYVWVSNGTAIRMSRDAGCHFDRIHPKPSSETIPREVTDHVITQLVAPNETGLWVSGYYDRGGAGAHQPHILWTPDGVFAPGNVPKEAFETADDGLPSLGTPLNLVVRAANTQLKTGLAYLLIEEPPDVASGDIETPVRRLYRVDLDTTLEQANRRTLLWKRITTLPDGMDSIDGLAMNRITGQLWLWSGKTYSTSIDNAATWDNATALGAITTIDVDDAGGAAVYSKAPDGSIMERVDSNLNKVALLNTPTPVTSAGHATRTGVVAISGPKGTYGYDAGVERWVTLTPPGAKTLTGLAFGRTGQSRMIVGATEKALYRLDLFAGESFVRIKGVGEKFVDINWFPESNLPGALLTPASQVVTVKPGELEDTTVKFRVPPSAPRLDVYFLVDTTLSMSNAIHGLKTGIGKIAGELKKRVPGGRACFGLGEVKDFGAGTGGEDSLRAYRRRVPIDCDITKIQQSLETLQQGGGDLTPEEAQTIGIVQALTGDGSESPPVDPGQSAEFDGNVRVIVTITDAGFKEEPQYPGFPTIATTIEELDAADTFMVGIAVHTENGNWPGAVADLTTVAEGSGTVAPPSGVDCNSDGKVDILPGRPLVCDAETNAPAEIAPAIIGLLLGIPDHGELEIEANDPDNVIVATSAGKTGNEVNKKIVAAADLKFETALELDATVSCTKDQDGKDLLVQFAGRVRKSIVKVAELVVQCRADAPPPPPPPPPPPIVEPVIPVIPVKPPMPLVPIPQFQPPPINNPPPNINPNAGFSQQEEQQFQLATVQQGAQENEQEETEEELAMVGVAHEDAAAATMLLGCATLVSVAGAGMFAHRRRVQRSLRPAYNRTRPF